VTATFPASKSGAEVSLARTLRGGGLRRVPKRHDDRLVLLATAAKVLERRYPYNELEINDELARWLHGVRAEVDHVTLRRFLVDFGFLKRDPAGKRYFLNYPKLLEILDADALALDAKALVDVVVRKERSRRRAWERDKKAL